MDNSRNFPQNLERDEQKIDSNCFGFAYFKLGLAEKEIDRIPSMEEMDSLFRKVRRIEDADGVVFRKKGSKYYTHMAVVDPQDKAYVFQRLNVGKPSERVPLAELKQFFEQDGFEIVLLKKKEQGSSRGFFHRVRSNL